MIVISLEITGAMTSLSLSFLLLEKSSGRSVMAEAAMIDRTQLFILPMEVILPQDIPILKMKAFLIMGKRMSILSNSILLAINNGKNVMEDLVMKKQTA